MKKVCAHSFLLLALSTKLLLSAGEPMSLVHFYDVEKRAYESKPLSDQDVIDYFRGITDSRVLGPRKSLTCLELAEVLCLDGHRVSFITTEGIVSQGFHEEFMNTLKRVGTPLSQIKEKCYDASDITLAPEVLEESIQQLTRNALVPFKLKKISNLIGYVEFLTKGRKSNMICLDQKLELQEGTTQHFMNFLKMGYKTDSVFGDGYIPSANLVIYYNEVFSDDRLPLLIYRKIRDYYRYGNNEKLSTFMQAKEPERWSIMGLLTSCFSRVCPTDRSYKHL